MKNQLVKINQNNQVITDSLTVASRFGKRHCDVLRSVKCLKCSKEFTERNFAFSEYLDNTGRKLPYCNMTYDGWMFLVMGFNGEKAATCKEKFIVAFRAMEAELMNRKPTFTEMLLGSRELKKENQAQKALIADLSAELLKSRPLWRQISRYQALELSNAEIGRLVGRATSTVCHHKTAMRRFRLLPAISADSAQLVLNFAKETIPGINFQGE